MESEFDKLPDGLTQEEIADVQAFRDGVAQQTAAMNRRPSKPPQVETVGDLILHSWPHVTSSQGVEAWLKAQGLMPIDEAGLRAMRDLGFPRGDEAIVALTGRENWLVNMMAKNANGHIEIIETEAVWGSGDDLPYPGWDWKEGTIFPARRKA
jgi:hypothetical protein